MAYSPRPVQGTGGGGGWFSDLGDIFSWGGGNQPQAAPAFDQPPQVPISAREGTLPPPNIPRMPPVPQGSGTSTPWGGQPNAYDMTTAEDAMLPPVEAGQGMEQASPKAYSFMDNPGASDAMVAFGAAMLKAPSFNQGLGDAALAVNQVAKSYRMPAEADYARAKQLGTVARIARGGSITDPTQAGGGIEVDQKTSFYGPDDKLYWAAQGPDGPGVWDTAAQQFIPGGVPGLQRATDSGIGYNNRNDSKLDGEAQQQAFIEAQSAQSFLSQLNEIKSVRPTAGVGLDKVTQTARRLTELTGMSFDNIDPSSISTMEAGVRQMALDWSQKMRGQGQVTESERQMIADMMPKAAMDPASFDRLVAVLERVQKRKIDLANEWFGNVQANRQQYGSFRNFALQRMEQMEQQTPLSQPPSGGSTSGGQRKSLNDIFQ